MKNICNTRKNGLSPLARGARHSQADPATALRFIPAGAGNTPASSVYSARSPVYPRWRGEHFSNLKPVGSLFGLSPLARGTQSNRYFKWPAVRFIPAGAGNSFFPGIHFPDRAVYPRWRGELYPALNLEIKLLGLSPLARGTPRATSATRINNRFIPAGAGNSHGIWQTSSTCTVYPRWRGELDSKPVTRTHQPGLSPLARGTPL